jgi:hypothetical protein
VCVCVSLEVVLQVTIGPFGLAVRASFISFAKIGPEAESDESITKAAQPLVAPKFESGLELVNTNHPSPASVVLHCIPISSSAFITNGVLSVLVSFNNAIIF